MAESFLAEGEPQEKTTNDMKVIQRAYQEPLVTMEKGKIILDT